MTLPNCYRCKQQPCECLHGFSEKDLQAALYWDRQGGGARMLMHDVTIGLWQQDFIEITRASYLYEFEIKLSRKDYGADMRKSVHNYPLGISCRKHDMLDGRAQAGSILLPRMFWFVMPTALAIRIQPPKHAGLLAATPVPFDWHCEFTILRPAPLIQHARKLQTADYHRILAAGTRKLRRLVYRSTT